MKEEREEVREEEHGITRRTFIKGAVAAGAVVAGGAVLGHDTLVKWLQRMGFYPFSDGFYVERLRQIVTQDPGSGRVIMWETPKESAGQMLEVQAPDVDDVLRFPAVDAAFTDDDVTVHQYLVEVDQLVLGVEYRYRITADGGTTAWL
ncbi:MAG: fibronectin type III domain-containing protein, partial [Selenomonas sp.]|nr:fibronectin type III domain-containing protein [Selenomonas sp.]